MTLLSRRHDKEEFLARIEREIKMDGVNIKFNAELYFQEKSLSHSYSRNSGKTTNTPTTKTNKIKNIKTKHRQGDISKNRTKEMINYAKDEIIRAWQEAYDNEKTGRRTAKLVPNINT